MNMKSANRIFINFFIILLLLLSNCSKNSTIDSNDNISLLPEAKSYMTLLVNDEKSLLDLPYSKLPANSNLRKFARLGKLEGKANWEGAINYNRGGVNYSIIPVDEVKNYPNSPAIESVRYLLFSKINGEKIQMNILEIYSNENTSFGTSIESIVRTSVENMLFNEANKISGISASVIFYDASYYNIKSYGINNGSWETTKNICKNTFNKPSIISKTNTLRTNSTSNVISSSSNNSNISLKAGTKNCTTYYLVMYSYDLQTGEILSVKIIRTETECTEDPYGEPSSDDSNKAEENGIEPSITNNLQDPCSAGLLNNTMGNIKKFITEALFNKNATTYFNFNSSISLPNDVGAKLRPHTRYDSDDNPHYEIDLNANQINNYSNEYILLLFLHEALHAVIKNNGDLPNENFWHHSAMGGKLYHDLLAQTLKDVFPDLKDDADALAWEGLEESLAWKQKDPNDQNKVRDVVDAYRNHKTSGKGTGCN